MATRIPSFNVPFGRYKGKSINDVPIGYIDWLVREREEGKDWTLNYEEFFDNLMEYINNENIKQEMSRDFDQPDENHYDEDRDE